MRELQDTADGKPNFPIKYYCVQPNKWTFQSDKIRKEVEMNLEGRVLNACSGKTHLEHDGEIVRNDLNPDIDADYHVDVTELTEQFERHSFDTVIFDPPYSQNKADELYNGISPKEEGMAFREIDGVLKGEGKVIHFGFTTTTMPGSLDYSRQLVIIYNTLGRMNDWLMTVDKRQNESLLSYE